MRFARVLLVWSVVEVILVRWLAGWLWKSSDNNNLF